MDAEMRSAISVIDPVSPALEKVKSLLFRPFDMGKWFTIGFCAWLASISQGGFHFNFPFNNQSQSGPGLEQAKDFFAEHLLMITVVASIVLTIVLAITITLLWLSCRGRFMFLHCIVENKAEVKAPWHKFSKPANSLWLFKLVSGLIAFACLAVCSAMIALMVVLLNRDGSGSNVGAISAIVLLSLITVMVLIITGLFFKFTNDFVVPTMYLRLCNCSEAWRQFLQILSSNKGNFVLYLLIQVVIGMVFATIILALVVGTCCCAAIFLIIPYIGTVLILPLLVFRRAYSLYYLRQFGAGFDVFAASVVEEPIYLIEDNPQEEDEG